ncbi:response regulator transcription factor [uncultured Chitinophaga sp.]|jgi:Response regulator containing a CheY-like receiver domain and an HTH DNA-binding domain|uniref:response regulator transcription factor n=1 Tax=uncultured Chitinophaga sp. TaxID=339340 RepID=UPI0026378E5C|nr:response regulator transcription factor [uncultured Chitinophaga sp.]
MENIRIALVDDHVMLRHGLAMLVSALGYRVLFECSNGQEMISRLDPASLPDIVLMDINMPEMDGYAATAWLKAHYPEVHVLTLSMYDDESAIIRMLKSGSRGYILKESEPEELKRAIHDVYTHGVHYTQRVTGKLLHAIASGETSAAQVQQVLQLNDREIEFLKLACTEMTYKEIADVMHLSPRTIDGYREALFEKLNVKNRVGLVLFAIRHNIIQVS